MKSNFGRQIEVCVLCTVEVGEEKTSSLQQAKAYIPHYANQPPRAPPASTAMGFAGGLSSAPCASLLSCRWCRAATSAFKKLGRGACPCVARPLGRSTAGQIPTLPCAARLPPSTMSHRAPTSLPSPPSAEPRGREGAAPREHGGRRSERGARGGDSVARRRRRVSRRRRC
jgi:hypothetical protein